MKKLIVKYWGVVLAVVLLSSLFVSSAPVSAGTLAYTAGIMPTDPVSGIVATGVGIKDFVVAGDGSTVYATTNGTARKSVDGGKTWIPLITGLVTNDKVAVAPDDPNFVAFLDAVNPNQVVLSLNGGSTFINLGSPRNAAGATSNTTNSIDISPSVAGIHYIAVAGTSGAGVTPALYYIGWGSALPSWADATVGLSDGFTAAFAGADTGFFAVKFSPNFPSDRIALVVGADATPDWFLHAVSFNSWAIDVFTSYAPNPPSYAGYPVNLNGAGPAAVGITSADIAIDPGYYGYDPTTRLSYIAIDGNGGANGGIFKSLDLLPTQIAVLSATMDFNSVALNADGSLLAAGETVTNNVKTLASPSLANANSFFSDTRVIKRPGTAAVAANMVVGFTGSSLVAANGGTAGCFSVSTDNGLTFNDISLVNVAVNAIQDFSINADASERYVVTSEAVLAITSVFYHDGTQWMRLLTINNNNGYLIQGSPETFGTVYLADTSNRNFYFATNYGFTNWFPRTMSAVPAGTIQDIELLNDSTCYVMVNNGNAFVSKGTNNGFLWSTATSPFAAAGASMTLVGEDKLIAGSATGLVSYTTNGAATWTAITTAVGGVANNVYADAADLATGSVIYAVNAANANVYSYTIGTSLAFAATGGAAAGGVNSTGIVELNGAIFTTSVKAGPDTELTRSLTPAVPASYSSAVTVAAPLGIGTINANDVPNVIKMTDGYTFWMIDALNTRIVTYTDSLANPANVPALQSPADGALIQVNNETGIPYNTTLIWGDASTAATYRCQVSWTEDFSQIVINNGAVADVFGGPQVLVVTAGGAGYQPGDTMYWRVRAETPFQSGWSEIYSFSIMPGQAMVAQLASPVNGSSVNSLTPGFSWSPLGGITSYSFELAAAPDFATTLYSTTTASAGAAIPSTVKLVRGQTYYWRVKALAPTEGAWSAVGNFMVAELVVTPEPTTQVTPTLTVVMPTPITTSVVITQEAPPPDEVVNPSYIWAIIIIGAVLVIAVIVLIVRTRRSV